MSNKIEITSLDYFVVVRIRRLTFTHYCFMVSGPFAPIISWLSEWFQFSRNCIKYSNNTNTSSGIFFELFIVLVLFSWPNLYLILLLWLLLLIKVLWWDITGTLLSSCAAGCFDVDVDIDVDVDNNVAVIVVVDDVTIIFRLSLLLLLFDTDFSKLFWFSLCVMFA